MKLLRPTALIVLILAILAAGCSIPGFGPTPAGPTALHVPSPTPLPAAQVIFNLIPPQGTPQDAELDLVILDEVTGLAFNPRAVPMRRLPDGRWQAELLQPAGSLLHYRYLRRSPGAADEFTAYGSGVLYRVASIPGPIQLDDIAAAWSDMPYQGPTGRIIGHLYDALTGSPLREMIVGAAGVTAFSDGEGTFRLDGLPPGLHTLIAFSPDGSYLTAQQGAVVAGDSATPADLGLIPAQRVQVAFEVTVPSDTVPGTPVRMAGSLVQLGNVFSLLPGGISNSAVHMPVLTQVDPTHYILVTSLYAGTDLRYKYTLGDGLWNAERAADGTFLTRQLIVPASDTVVQDTVSTWRGGDQGAVTLHVTVPADTPAGDQISIQFNPFSWFEPLPMASTGPNEWLFVLHSPLDFRGSLGYRYCRNYECGGADDIDTAGPDAAGRSMTPAAVPQDLQDTVRAWQWWGTGLPPLTVVAPEITPRTDFEAGIEMLPDYRPSWSTVFSQSLQEIAGEGANAVTLTPTWTLGRTGPEPGVSFDPAHGPFLAELRAMIDTGHRWGLGVSLRPSLRPLAGDSGAWWISAPRDAGWWAVWYESYRSFILTYARLAAEAGVEKLVLGGPEAAPALPDGRLPDGSPSRSPSDAEARWRNLIAEVRSAYGGRLAFEIELGRSLQPPPPFLDAVDEIHVYWHAPLGSGTETSPAEMQASAARLLDTALLATPGLVGRPIILSVEYLSLDGSAAACAPAPDGSCRPPEAFDSGAVVDPDLQIDLTEQAQALNAVLAEAYARSQVTGFYSRGYNPAVAQQDRSASVNGKPAQDVLRYWYPRITGR